MSPESIEVIMRRFYDAWEQNDHDGLAALLSDNATNHYLESGVTRQGIEFELATCELWHEAFSDVRITFNKVVENGDYATLIWALESTHSGTFLGIAPTNKRIQVMGIELVRVSDGEIVEIWRMSDQSTLMAQLRPPPRNTSTLHAVTE